MVEIVVDYNKVCKDCNDPSLVFMDSIAGDLVCTGCGLVLEEKCFDSSTEWRSFKTDGVGSGQDVNSRERADVTSSYMEGEDYRGGTAIYGTGALAQGLQKAMLRVDGQAEVIKSATQSTCLVASNALLQLRLAGLGVRKTMKERDVDETRIVAWGDSVRGRTIDNWLVLSDGSGYLPISLDGKQVLFEIGEFIVLSSTPLSVCRTMNEKDVDLARRVLRGTTVRGRVSGGWLALPDDRGYLPLMLDGKRALVEAGEVSAGAAPQHWGGGAAPPRGSASSASGGAAGSAGAIVPAEAGGAALQVAGGLTVGAGAASSSRAPSGLGLRFEQDVEHRIQVFTKKVQELVSRMAIGDNVVQRCIALMQQLAKRDKLPKKKELAWVCALVHLATVEEKCTQTVCEIAQANVSSARLRAASAAAKPVQKDLMEKRGRTAQSDAFEVSINGHVRDLTSILGLARQKLIVEDTEVMQRLVRLLELSPNVAVSAQQIVQKAMKLQASGMLKMSKLPSTSVIAASIFVVAYLLDVPRKPEFQQVAAHARCTESQVRAAYKAFHSKLRYLVPETLRIQLPGGLSGLPVPR